MTISQSFSISKRRGAPPDAPGGSTATPFAASSPADNGRGCEAGADRITAERRQFDPAKPRKSGPTPKHCRLKNVPLESRPRPEELGTPEWKAKDAVFVRAVIREGRRLGLL